MDPALALRRADGSPISILDVANHPVDITSLWSQRTVIIVFVRHFLCIDCQDYFRDVWAAFTRTDYAERHVQLVVIGCGTPKLARSLAEDLGAYGHPAFAIYTDPERAAYSALGLVYANQFEVGRCLRGMVRTAYDMLIKCWCICHSGDTRQNGGVFVLDKGTGARLYAHVDQQPNDHAPVGQVMKAAGLTYITGPQHQDVS